MRRAPGADAGAIAARVKRLQLGLPAEDEFSVLLNWLGHCRLVHKLDQLQRPQESRKHLRVPDLLAIFTYKGRDVPVLIEVKSSVDKTLSWQPGYHDALQRYADTLKLPLLIAWRRGTFWSLFEARHLTKAVKNFNIKFGDAMDHAERKALATKTEHMCGTVVESISKFREAYKKDKAILDKTFPNEAFNEQYPMRYVLFQLMRRFTKDSFSLDTNHIRDFFHAAVPVAHANMVALLKYIDAG